jgi:hypothetical protein
MPDTIRANPFLPLPGNLERLPAIAWRQLSDACDEPSHPWRLANLANVVDGTPHQRIVVLRAADQNTRHVIAHTDARSPKMDQLHRQPRVSWLFYDWQLRIQLTMQGTMSLHAADAVAEQRWNETAPGNLAMYLAPHPPGTETGEPTTNQPDWLPQREATRADISPGQENFAVLQGQIDSLDLLFIRREGNLRASFDWNGNHWQGTWRAP